MTDTTPLIAQAQLRSLVERIESAEALRKTYADDVRDIYKEAKGAGYSVKALRTVIRRRQLDAAERTELDSLLDMYENALT